MKIKDSKITIHLLVWVALIMINIFVIGGYSSPLMATKLGMTIVVWIIYFYLNYLLLIPKLMLRKKVLLYILCLVLSSSGAFVAFKLINIHYTKRSLETQLAAMKQYSDIKQDYEEKERTTWRMMSEREGKRFESDNRRGNDKFPQPRESFRDDSLPQFTEREEAYEKLLRDYRRSKRFERDVVNTNYNPFIFFNLQYLYTIVFLFLASLAVAFIQRSVKTERRRLELEGEKSATELAYLKQQINPHFLFNTLNAIYSYTIPVSEEASEAVLKLSSMLRYMLYEANRERVPLSDEIKVVYDFIDLQRLRITDKTKVSIEIQGDATGHQIEPMLLIPILENAFKFGIDSFESSFIKIDVRIEKSQFTFNVSNKVVNRISDTASGIGIKNIDRRLDLIYGENNYSLSTLEKEGVFYTSLNLNLKD